MFIYSTLGLLILFIYVFTKYPSYGYYNKNRLFTVCSYIILTLVAGLRGNFAADYDNYYYFFKEIISHYTLNDVIHTVFYQEKGFVILNRLIGYFTDSGIVFMFCISALTLLLFFYSIYKYSNMMWLSLILFIGIGSYYDSFNVSRQILSAAISFLGIKYIIEQKFLKYALIVTLASFFHRTAFVLIPCYFLLNLKFSKKLIALYIVYSVFLYISLQRIIVLIKIYVPQYSEYDVFLGAGNINWLIVPCALMLFAIFMLLGKKCDKFILESKVTQVCVNGVIAYFIFTLLGTQSQLVARLATFMQPFSWILIPNLIYGYKNKDEKQIILILIIILALLYPIVTLSGTGYDPYRFCF